MEAAKNALHDAKMYSRLMDGDVSTEVGATYAQRSMACSLIAIAEELRAMNERAELTEANSWGAYATEEDTDEAEQLEPSELPY